MVSSAGKPDPRQALYDEYLAVPDYLRAEIIDGTLYVSPRPSPRHANASSVLGTVVNGAFQLGRGGPGGWWIIDEPELQLDELQPMVPDLAGWKIERMPTLPDTAYFALAPDWICEVLSKSTEHVDRDNKMPRYAAHGVGHVWLVDPIAWTLEVYTLGDDRRWRTARTYSGHVKVRAEPFAAIEIDLAALWGDPAGAAR